MVNGKKTIIYQQYNFLMKLKVFINYQQYDCTIT